MTATIERGQVKDLIMTEDLPFRHNCKELCVPGDKG